MGFLPSTELENFKPRSSVDFMIPKSAPASVAAVHSDKNHVVFALHRTDHPFRALAQIRSVNFCI
jgi:hypothetical protein